MLKLTHSRGGPSSGLKEQGGRISGVVCGVDIEYTVEHGGDHVALSGFLENQHASQMKIIETEDARIMVGSLGTREVRLTIREDSLQGYVGRCPYDMRRGVPSDEDSDTLMQNFRGFGETMEVRLSNPKELWKMPAADQAAVLPLMMLCVTEKIFQNLGRPKVPTLGFGKPGAVPSGTIQFSGSGNRDCGGRS